MGLKLEFNGHNSQSIRSLVNENGGSAIGYGFKGVAVWDGVSYVPLNKPCNLVKGGGLSFIIE